MWKPIYLRLQFFQRLWISVCVFVSPFYTKTKTNNNFHPLLVVAEHFSSQRSFTVHTRKRKKQSEGE